ncbi:MAG: rod shape-determining protein MreD [Nitrospiraceae bacterium]|nr:MAG: rod shape-determining protein MreD [Nitrospiraceae bacterium]
MKIFVPYLLFAYLALAVQSVFFHGIKPDLVLLLVCFYSVRCGQVKSVAYGAVAGLLIDTASGFILGPNIISKSLAAFLASTIRENLFQWNPIISTLMVAVLSFIDVMLVYICFETFSSVSFVNRSLWISALEVVYTVAAALILYPVFNRREKGLI